ncbi:MAG: hypothetical protein JW940_38615 [Polyangiaceae bacterium]|nr:hypothetical protein [Polyangiaceae bacterium]
MQRPLPTEAMQVLTGNCAGRTVVCAVKQTADWSTSLQVAFALVRQYAAIVRSVRDLEEVVDIGITNLAS